MLHFCLNVNFFCIHLLYVSHTSWPSLLDCSKLPSPPLCLLLANSPSSHCPLSKGSEWPWQWDIPACCNNSQQNNNLSSSRIFWCNEEKQASDFRLCINEEEINVNVFIILFSLYYLPWSIKENLIFPDLSYFIHKRSVKRVEEEIWMQKNSLLFIKYSVFLFVCFFNCISLIPNNISS